MARATCKSKPEGNLSSSFRGIDSCTSLRTASNSKPGTYLVLALRSKVTITKLLGSLMVHTDFY